MIRCRSEHENHDNCSQILAKRPTTNSAVTEKRINVLTNFILSKSRTRTAHHRSHQLWGQRPGRRPQLVERIYENNMKLNRRDDDFNCVMTCYVTSERHYRQYCYSRRYASSADCSLPHWPILLYYVSSELTTSVHRPNIYRLWQFVHHYNVSCAVDFLHCSHGSRCKYARLGCLTSTRR